MARPPVTATPPTTRTATSIRRNRATTSDDRPVRRCQEREQSIQPASSGRARGATSHESRLAGTFRGSISVSRVRFSFHHPLNGAVHEAARALISAHAGARSRDSIRGILFRRKPTTRFSTGGRGVQRPHVRAGRAARRGGRARPHLRDRSGEAAVLVDGNEVRKARPGDSCCETALIDKLARSATVRADTEGSR